MKKKEETILYMIVPCYNEEEGLKENAKKLEYKIKELITQSYISKESRIVFVDDGSRDQTWKILEELSDENERYIALQLASNRGHQNAILAGLMFAKDEADVTITIDCDLQQDIEAIKDFLEKYYEGNEIVYGVRYTRDTDSFFKKTTANCFYKLIALLGCEIHANAADYRLMSKVALEALSEYKEVNLFLRGIIPSLGFQTDLVYFNVYAREFGTSKYSFGKMMKLALEGITSFSIRPIRMVLAMGVFALLVSLGMIFHAVYEYYFGYTVSGWSSMLVSIWALGGLNLLAIGIIGEYIGQSYLETKRRPRYYISKVKRHKG